VTKASDNEFPKVILDVGTIPAAPTDGTWKLYAASGGVYAVSSNATAGPFGAGGGALTDHTHAATGTGADGGGASLVPTSLSPSGLVALNSGIASAIDADQNNWNPASLHTVAEITFTSFTANRTLTGMDAGANGEMKFLVNNTNFSLVLAAESGSSTDVNRFRCPNSNAVTVRKYGSVLLAYFYGRWCTAAI